MCKRQIGGHEPSINYIYLGKRFTSQRCFDVFYSRSTPGRAKPCANYLPESALETIDYV